MSLCSRCGERGGYITYPNITTQRIVKPYTTQQYVTQQYITHQYITRIYIRKDITVNHIIAHQSKNTSHTKTSHNNTSHNDTSHDGTSHSITLQSNSTSHNNTWHSLCAVANRILLAACVAWVCFCKKAGARNLVFFRLNWLQPAMKGLFVCVCARWVQAGHGIVPNVSPGSMCFECFCASQSHAWCFGSLRCVNFQLWSVKSWVRRSVKCKMQTAVKCNVWSEEWGVWIEEFRVSSVERGVKSAKCGG